MGFLLGGPYYFLQGRTGNNVGRVVKGRNVFAMRPTKSSKPATEAQLQSQMKLGLITGWMGKVSSFLGIGFSGYDSKMSGWNAAVGYNIENSITGVAPNYTIDYPKARFSQGELEPALNMVVAVTEDAQLDFSWDANVGVFEGHATDRAVFIVYNPAKQKFVMVNGPAVRSTLSYDMALPVLWSGDSVHIYSCFVKADNGEVSTTEYVGTVVVQ